jgi:SPP1 gp7 family putative phage head morphogenesis protein
MARLSEWADKQATDSELHGLLWTPMAHSDLAGQLFVREIEIPHTTRSLAAEFSTTFLNQPFAEAIRSMEARGLIDDEGVADLVATYRARGQEAAQAALRQLQRRTEAELLRALERGETLSSFAAAVQDGRAGLGFEAASPSYLETVFRSTIQGSYGAGRFRGMTAAAAAGSIQYVQRRAVGDANTRASHLALDGKVWEATDTEWHRFSPPLLDGRFEYNCRCTSVAVPADQVDPAMLSVSVRQAETQADGPLLSNPLDAVQTPIEAAA